MNIWLKHTEKQYWHQLLNALKQNNIHSVLYEKAGLVVLTRQVSDLWLKPYAHLIQQVSFSSHPLASKSYKAASHIQLGDITIGGADAVMMAGPCSVESEEQIFSIAAFLSAQGVKVLRGGAYKPRTSPYSFRGLGLDGLKLLRKAADTYHMHVITEIMDLRLLDEVMQYTDILQVGSRNMQNFYMLAELGKINKPVLLKRGMHAKAKEWLLAAEYILSGGNEQVMLCERGIRSFDPDTRNVMDIGIIPLIKELSHLPIIADPSHGTGAASRVEPMALASVIAGAHGLLIEVHPDPANALSDKHQAVDFETFKQLNQQVQKLIEFKNNLHFSSAVL